MVFTVWNLSGSGNFSRKARFGGYTDDTCCFLAKRNSISPLRSDSAEFMTVQLSGAMDVRLSNSRGSGSNNTARKPHGDPLHRAWMPPLAPMSTMVSGSSLHDSFSMVTNPFRLRPPIVLHRDTAPTPEPGGGVRYSLATASLGRPSRADWAGLSTSAHPPASSER